MTSAVQRPDRTVVAPPALATALDRLLEELQPWRKELPADIRDAHDRGLPQLEVDPPAAPRARGGGVAGRPRRRAPPRNDRVFLPDPPCASPLPRLIFLCTGLENRMLGGGTRINRPPASRNDLERFAVPPRLRRCRAPRAGPQVRVSRKSYSRET